MPLSRVQSTGKVAAIAAPTLSLTFATPPSVGHAIVVAVAAHKDYVFPALDLGAWTCTDTSGNVYFTALNGDDAAFDTAKMFFCPVVTATGAPFTITLTFYRTDGQVSPATDAFACAVEVGGVGASLGIHRTAFASTSIGPVFSTDKTPGLNVGEVFLFAMLQVAQSDGAHVCTIQALTPPWVEEVEQITITPGGRTIKGEIDSRLLTDVPSGTQVEAIWTCDFQSNYDGLLVAFMADGPVPTLAGRVSQTALETLHGSLAPPDVRVSQAATEALVAYTGPPAAQVSQSAIEALQAHSAAGVAIRVSQTAVEAVRAYDAAAALDARLSQLPVEVIQQVPTFALGTVPPGCALSAVALEVLVPVASVTAPNLTEATAWGLSVPTELQQDWTALPPEVLRDEPPVEPSDEPPDCVVRVNPLQRADLLAYLAWQRQRWLARQPLSPRAPGFVYCYYQYTATPDDAHQYLSLWVTTEPSSTDWHQSAYLYVTSDANPEDDLAYVYLAATALYGPVFWRLTPGLTYTIQIRSAGPAPSPTPPRVVRLSLVRSLNLDAPVDAILVNDDSDPKNPLVIMSPTTGEVIQLRAPFPDGEWAAVLPNGVSLWSSYDGGLHLFDAALVPIATLSPADPEAGYHWFVRSNRRDTFYVLCRHDPPSPTRDYATLFHVTQTGEKGPDDEWGPFPLWGDSLPEALGISADERYAYLGARSAINYQDSVQRWDLTTNTLATPLVGEGLGFLIDEILTLNDGSVIVGYGKYLGQNPSVCACVRFSAEGVRLNTYVLASEDTYHLNHLSDAADGESFWVWLYGATNIEAGRNRFLHIRASDGVYLHDVMSTTYGDGYYQGPDYPVAPAARFGHPGSCPFVVLTQPLAKMSGGPGGGPAAPLACRIDLPIDDAGQGGSCPSGLLP